MAASGDRAMSVREREGARDAVSRLREKKERPAKKKLVETK
jgi:hypothetical protein